jgi:predicted small lipoprotein YifL
MRKIFNKGLVLICSIAILLVPLISACGKKAPPRPPAKESGDQSIKNKSD